METKKNIMKRNVLVLFALCLVLCVIVFIIYSLTNKAEDNHDYGQYKHTWTYVEGTAVALTEDYKLVLIDADGRTVCIILDKNKGDSDRYFNLLYGNGTSADRLLSYDGKLFWIIDRKGKVCSKGYRYAHMTDDGSSFIVSDDLVSYYFVDGQGNDLNHGKRWEKISGYFFFWHDGETIDNCCVVKENGLYGITDRKGSYIITPKYTQIKEEMNGGMYGITIDGDVEVLQESGC